MWCSGMAKRETKWEQLGNLENRENIRYAIELKQYGKQQQEKTAAYTLPKYKKLEYHTGTKKYDGMANIWRI